MSILTSPTKIQPAVLKEHGFWKDGWGSPNTRKAKKADMWTKVDNGLEIKWFPTYWEGTAYCHGTMLTTELRGRCWIADKFDCDYFSPVLDSFDELLMFIRSYKKFPFPKLSYPWKSTIFI